MTSCQERLQKLCDAYFDRFVNGGQVKRVRFGRQENETEFYTLSLSDLENLIAKLHVTCPTEDSALIVHKYANFKVRTRCK